VCRRGAARIYSASAWLTAYRQLDPELGRWFSEDPLRSADGTNRYAYVLNNPINRFDPLGLKSYMCKKPLYAMGGNGKRSGPDVWGNPLYHQYYCVERNGVMTCCGQDRSGNAFLSAGKASQDSFDPETCSPLDTSPCQEDCLMKKCSSGRPSYGIGPQGTDCQEWSDNAVKDCKKCEQKK
jgi:RHS repeat-associated protein